MCLITFCPLNIEIPLSGIESGAQSNPDGHGWVVASDAFGLVMGKSMNAKEAIEGFVAERARQGDNSVAMFHSRLGTHGSKNLANVHPFYVPDSGGGDNGFNTVVAHNGIMPNLWHPDKKDDRSDTRVFADQTATWYLTERGVPSRRGGKAIGEMIGRGNKLVFISTRMPGRPHTRIVNADAGTWEGGVWFSNVWFKQRRTPARTSYPNNASKGRVCSDKDCNTTFYSGTPSVTQCFLHRPERFCEVKGCMVKFDSIDGQTKCYKHRQGSGYVSPYADDDKKEDTKPPQWQGYGIFPGDETDEEIDEETLTLLDDIDESLADVVKVTDIDPDRKCEVCKVVGGVHMPTNLCLNCFWCLDCWVHMDQCECFDYQKWLRDRDKETADLAAALADLDGDAEADRLAREEAEAEHMVGDLVADNALDELTQTMRDFYGITDEMIAKAKEANAEARAARDAAEAKPPRRKPRGKARPATTGPPSTTPTVKSGR